MSARVAIVTGSGQGIGRAIAMKFASHGLRVALADRNLAAANSVAAEIVSAGGEAVGIATELTESQSVDAMVAQVVSHFGGCDILVNNARWSGLAPTPVQEIADEDWRRALDVNVTGAFHCVRAAVPHMIAAKWGRIINLSSSTVRMPPGRPYVHYITTKAALIGMTRALARELGVHGVTVNAILPGAVETGVERPGGIDVAERERRVRASQAIPRIIKPEDMAGAALFLASDDASFITGQSLAVDGGFSFG
jgi:3-oxoacyl-[acyl-carrier protein] reductase